MFAPTDAGSLAYVPQEMIVYIQLSFAISILVVSLIIF